MKKTFRFLLSTVIVLSLCLTVLPFSTFAAGTIIRFSKSSFAVGDTVTVYVDVTGSELHDLKLDGTFNSGVLNYVSGANSNSGDSFRIFPPEGLGGASKKTFAITFKAVGAGTSGISVSGAVTDGVPPVEVNIGASANLTVTEPAAPSTPTTNNSSTNTPAASGNANLKSLSVSAGSLSPRFAQSRTSYTVNVGDDVTKCDVYATAVDSNANVSIGGSANLNPGKNTRTVTVTAQNGTKKTYTITINRGTAEETTSSEVEEAPTVMQTVVDGVSYIVLNDITGVELPTGFNAAKKTLNDQEVAVAMDENESLVLYYLKPVDGDAVTPYLYDANKKAFKKVQIITQGSNSYIVSEIPTDLTVTEEFTTKMVKIQDMDIECFISSNEKLKDMYYVFCYFGGDYAMYRYDSVENIIQRCPEFELVPVNEVEETSGSDIELFNRFSKLSTNAKTTVVCLCVVLLGAIALIILLIVKLAKRTKKEDLALEDSAEDFDSVTFDDNYEIISEEKTEETEE